MRSILFLAAGLISCVSASPVAQADPPQDDGEVSANREQPTIQLDYATVIGSSRHGIDSFRGIPFAQPPVGPLRLQRPQPITQNLGTVDATAILPASCPQQYTSTNPNVTVPQDALQEILNSGAVQRLVNINEDCLTVSVQKPHDATPDSKYPVVFSVFYGGFGFGTTAIYDATKLIQAGIDNGKPIVYIAVNYRLGAFGWLAGKEVLDAGLTNLGHYDQILALQWVQDNIAKFGGDPDKVTLFGTSAGGISTWNLLTAKDGNLRYNDKPLFRAAIMDSGSVIPTDPADCPKAQNIFNTVVRAGGCEGAADKIDCLRALPYDQFLQASTSVPGLFDYPSVALSYIPRYDGDLLTDSADNLCEAGKYANVPYIVGDQEDEGTLFSLVQSNITTTQDIIDYFKAFYFSHASDQLLSDLVNLYPDDPAAGSPYNTGTRNNIYPQYKRLASIIGDMTFTMIRRLILGFGTKVKPEVPLYSFIASYGYGTPILGSFHVSDVLPAYGITPGFPTRSIQYYYINFVHDLDPNSGGNPEFTRWPAWNENKEVINFRRSSNEIWKDDFRSQNSDFLAANRPALRF